MIKSELTSLLGTHIGVLTLKTPASIDTPHTMGSRLLKIKFGRTRILLGKTAMFLNSSCFWRLSSAL